MTRTGKLLTRATVILLAFMAPGLRADCAFPGAEWEFRTPEEVGLDAGGLQDFSNFTGGRGGVTRYGYMVHTWGNQCHHGGSYSFLWWISGVDEMGQRHWPDAPDDTYGAFGHGGPRAMVVIPSLDIVLSWNDADLHSDDEINRALALIAGAVVSSPGPVPGQIVVNEAHPAWFKYHEGGPFYMCGPGDPEGFLYRGTRNPDGTRDGDQMELIDKLSGTGAGRADR